MLRTEAIDHSIRRLMFVFSVPVIRSFVHCILNYVTDVLTALDGGVPLSVKPSHIQTSSFSKFEMNLHFP